MSNGQSPCLKHPELALANLYGHFCSQLLHLRTPGRWQSTRMESRKPRKDIWFSNRSQSWSNPMKVENHSFKSEPESDEPALTPVKENDFHFSLADPPRVETFLHFHWSAASVTSFHHTQSATSELWGKLIYRGRGGVLKQLDYSAPPALVRPAASSSRPYPRPWFEATPFPGRAPASPSREGGWRLAAGICWKPTGGRWGGAERDSSRRFICPAAGRRVGRP